MVTTTDIMIVKKYYDMDNSDNNDNDGNDSALWREINVFPFPTRSLIT